MTQRNARPPIDQIDEAGQEVSQAAAATVIMTRPGDGIRARRIKKFARRELDDLCGIGLDPWRWAEPVGDVFADARLTVPERRLLGEELRQGRWVP